jgi:PKD repeat protein
MTLSSTDFIIGDLNVGEAKEVVFEAVAEDAVALGTPVFVLVSASGASYYLEENMSLVIGYIPNYCESSALYNGFSDLTSFSLGQLHNNSEGDNGTYDDYTLNEDLVFEFMQGGTYDISVTLSSLEDGVTKCAKVFVDWNYDGDFIDLGESVFFVSPQSDNFTETGYITIPSDVELGPKYMRVVAQQTDGLDDISPCGTYFLGGTEDYKIVIIPIEPPVVDFETSTTETTQGDVVEFTDRSENWPSSWQWEIMPGIEGEDYVYINQTTSTSQNPQVKFQSVGIYSVELAATNASGTVAHVKPNYITINEITDVPTADFEVDDSIILPAAKLHLIDLSTNTPIAWEWQISPGLEGVEFNFVDGTDMYSENPVIVFNIPGVYTVQLTAFNVLGASVPLIENDLIEVLVPNYCESGASYDLVTDLTEFSFGPLLNNTEGYNDMYDDYTQNEELVFEFMRGATYDVSLTISSSDSANVNCAKVFVDWNYDGDFIDPDETVFSGCSQSDIFTHTGLISVPSNVPLGPKRLRVVVQKTIMSYYVSPCGTYYLGGTEDYKIVIIPLEPPVANFEASKTETIPRDIIMFTDKSTNTPNSWQWTISPGIEGEDYLFVDGTSSLSQNPHLKFLKLGQYSIELNSSNDAGNGNLVKTNYITIHDNVELPIADFSIGDSVVYSIDTLRFTDLSINTPTEWEWTISPGSEGVEYRFVEGTNMYSQNPAVVFNQFGFYTVQLVASNIIGDSDPYIENDIIEVENAYFMQNGSFITCDGTFYDARGPNQNYYTNTNLRLTFYPAEEGKMIRFDFTEFALGMDGDETCYDKLVVYNGASTSNEIIGVFCQTNPLDSVIASNLSGALTFLFQSDYSETYSGWTANISCVDGAPYYEVKLIVTIDDQPASGVLIMCDGSYRVTNSNGEAVFYMDSGVYGYSFSHSVLGTVNGTFEVFDEDLIVNLAYTGINSVSEPDLKIYPNPALGIINVDIDKEIGKCQIEVLDLQGRIMISQQADKMKSVIDVSSLTEGVYQIVIQNDLYHYVQKMIKQ